MTATTLVVSDCQSAPSVLQLSIVSVGGLLPCVIVVIVVVWIWFLLFIAGSRQRNKCKSNVRSPDVFIALCFRYEINYNAKLWPEGCPVNRTYEVF